MLNKENKITYLKALSVFYFIYNILLLTITNFKKCLNKVNDMCHVQFPSFVSYMRS